MKFWSGLTAIVACLVLGSTASAAITMVTVGDAGNRPDTATGYGAVDYDYSIGKYEVTAGQYAEFLNAVAATDTYSLYNANMANTSYGSGITRSGSSGNYSYSVVDQAFVNRPVNWVSFWDAARFCNWLHNGQGNGDTESGAYINIGNQTTFARQAAGAKFFIPTENEWYKAAYYKGGGTDAGYWLYPTQNDSAPGRDMEDASGNNANYCTSLGLGPIDSDKYTTIVGEFENSDSAYGTFDQGGNVWEWNEAVIGSSRGLRGGSFGYYFDSYRLASSTRDFVIPPTDEYNDVGFRVASSVSALSDR